MIKNIKCKKININEIENAFYLYCKEEGIEAHYGDINKAKQIYKRMLNRDSYTVGAWLDERLVGVINVNKILDYYPKYLDYPYVHLETFIVDKEYQNMGIGTYLFKETLSLIKNEGVSYIIIQSCNKFVQKIAQKSGLTESLKDMRIDFISQ